MSAADMAVIFASYLPVLVYMIKIESRLVRIETKMEAAA